MEEITDESKLTFKLESTEALQKLLTKEEIEAFAQLFIKEIQEGRPKLDGDEDIGATHTYTHTSGTKLATYTLFNPSFSEVEEFEWTVFIGLEDEIEMLVAEFESFQHRLQPIVNESPKIGRNDFCPCGSKKKYKKCCL